MASLSLCADVSPPPPPPSQGTMYDFLLKEDAEGIEDVRLQMELWCACSLIITHKPQEHSTGYNATACAQVS